MFNISSWNKIFLDFKIDKLENETDIICGWHLLTAVCCKSYFEQVMICVVSNYDII